MLALLALACSSAPEPSVPAPAATAEEPAHVEAPAAPALDTEPYRQQAKALLALI